MTTTTEGPPATAWPKPAAAWYSVIVLAIAYAFGFLDRIVISLLAGPIQADLGLNDTQFGVLAGLAFALFYTALGIPIGWLADRSHRRNIIAAGIALWSVATAACGLAKDFWTLFTARIFVGVGEATLGPTSSSYIADLFPPQERPKAYGLYVMGTAIGTGLAFVVTGVLIGALADTPTYTVPLIGELASWHLVFIIVGLPGVLVAGLMLTTIEPPRRGRIAAVEGVPEKEVPFSEVFAFMARRKLAFAATFLVPLLIIMPVYGGITWQPSFFFRVHEWTPSQYAIWNGALGMCAGIFSAISSGFVVAFLAKRGRRDAPLLVILAGTVMVVATHVVMVLMPTGELALAASVVGSLFVNWPSAAALTAINQITPNEMRARVTALYYIVLGLGATAAGPLIVGGLTDYVFGDKLMVGWSLGLTYLVSGTLGAVALAVGLGAFRKATDAAAAWEGK